MTDPFSVQSANQSHTPPYLENFGKEKGCRGVLEANGLEGKMVWSGEGR